MSGAGKGGSKRQRASTAFSNLEKGINFMHEAQRKLDLEFIMRELKGPKKHMTSDIATLLRARRDSAGLWEQAQREKVHQVWAAPSNYLEKRFDNMVP